MTAPLRINEALLIANHAFKLPVRGLGAARRQWRTEPDRYRPHQLPHPVANRFPAVPTPIQHNPEQLLQQARAELSEEGYAPAILVDATLITG